MRSSSIVILIVLIIIVVGVTTYILYNSHVSNLTSIKNNQQYGGAIGQNTFTQVFVSIKVSEAVQMMKEIPSYAKIFPDNDTIVFNSTYINLIVLATTREEAINLTGQTPPSTENDTFVIYGLANPTLIFLNNAKVNITIINLDNSRNNFAITPVSPPYPYCPVLYIKTNFLGGGPPLPPINQTNAYEYYYTVTFNQPGTYYYLSAYKAQAEMGMYGEIIVE